MAQYTITHTCGHEITHSLAGKIDARFERLEWLKTQPCSDCQKKAKAEADAVKNDESGKATKEIGLVELQGSEKQIAWANTIRLEAYNWLLPKVLPNMQALFWASINAPMHASWWIDHKDLPPKEMFEAINKDYKIVDKWNAGQIK